MTRDEVMAAVSAERDHQATLWGGTHTWGVGDCSSTRVPLPIRLAVLMEEVGEVARAILERDDPHALRAELIQVAAVAVAIAESLP
jgi:hypothetical protein